MKKYNTYQEAKIENKNDEIATNGIEFATARCLNLSHAFKWKICNPKDHCMTVEKFLADGHKFVDCDCHTGTDGVVRVVGSDYPVSDANLRIGSDRNRYILRAAALEKDNADDLDGESVTESEIIDLSLSETFDVMPKDNEAAEAKAMAEHSPKRTKEECVKVEFEHAWQAVKAFEEGEELFVENPLVSSSKYLVAEFSSLKCVDKLYRKVVTELTEREAFIEAACKVVPTTAEEDIKVIGKMFDSGKFKLSE
jgi:hypothetical protein